MDKVARFVFESISSGKINKETGVEILKAIKLEENRQKKQDIAIIGMALRLPSADDLDVFWDNLKTGMDCVTEFPESRRKDADGLIQYTYVRGRENIEYCRGGYIEDIDRFDYKFFGLSPREASLMDPNQRMFLEAAAKAVEDAGYGGGSLSGSSTGLYVGYSGWPMYGQFVSHAEPESMDLSVLGNISAIIAGRLSNFLNIKGPSMLIDTACSSSLTALHLACKGIMNGDCGQAIVGGIRTLLMPVDGTIKYGIESRDFKARPFDENADGTPLSEGITAVLIKPLGKALKDGDNIYAVIKGSAVNQDGFTQGFVTPNAASQTGVLTSAWNDAGIEPETISYIEAHGIGTKVGDPVEIEGISKAFKRYTDKKQFCAIGALKSSIGHTDSCAGLAAVIKAVLALRNRQIPPVVNFKSPNNNINFLQSPVYVNDRLRDWEEGISPRRCGISCFGFGGTNCHVVLEEYAEHGGRAGESKGEINYGAALNKWNIFTLSAISQEALKRSICKYREFIGKRGFSAFRLEDVCYTANTGRGCYNGRLALVVRDKRDLEEKLMGIDIEELQDKPESGVFYGYHKRFDNETVAGLNEDADLKIKEIILEGSRRKDLFEELCRMYTSGAKINWEKLYVDEKRRKLSLPTYQFDKHRCWINVPDKSDRSNTHMETEEILENILDGDISFNF